MRDGDSDAARPRLLFPALEGFYSAVDPLVWPLIRLAVGWNLAVHGWGKVIRGPDAYLKSFAEMGFNPPLPWFWAGLGVEFVGGIAILLGLFTRFFAAAAAIEMAIITWLYWNNGFAWLARGYEYVLMWGLVCLAIALRGGGSYSLDRLIGREL